ncbi:MAG: AAA family ATPase [Candidatus Thiodiazotropha sp.]
MLIWIKDAPQIDESSSEEVTKFVDMHVSCSIASDNEELAMLVQTLQKHSHSPACRKQGKTCRFSFPRPPIEETTVFMPPETPVTDSNKTVYCDVLTDVQEKLSSLQHETELTLSELLKDLKVPDGLYKRALQWIKTKQGRPSVVIKRKPNEGFINNYNPHILQAWQANMDIQFVDHVQACVMYVSSYISKPEKTLGDVLKSVSKTCEPQGPKRMMETVAKKFLSHREVSAQEAVYRLLSLPLIKGSRQILFVPTDLPDHRTKLFKPLKVIQELDDDDEDLYLSGIIDKYEERSPSLDNICLADFAAYYTYSRSKKNSEFNEDVNTDVDQDCEQIDEVATFPKTIILQNSGTKLTKRARPAIIRTHQFSQDRQEEQFHHSKLLLYYPWRNEEIDLKAEDGLYKTKYMREFEKFAAKLCEYEPNAEEFRQAFEDLQQNGPPEDAWATLAPETEQQQAEDVLHGTENDPEYEALAPHTQMEPRDLGIIQCEYEHQTRLVSNPKWLDMISSLNDEQKKVHQFILEWCIKMSMTNKTKERPPPFHLFLTGGAGVGKSHVVKTVVQTAKRLLNVGQGEDEITVMVCAFTGAAAFNVEGHTLHSAFHLPVGESKQDDYIRLSNEQLAAMRSKLGSLCILIIDEISMVGTDQLLTIHRRLAEVMTSDDPFGGVSILAVGDLFQLPPVGHTPVFEAPKDPVVAALYGSLWKKHFKFIELKEVMRQKEDSQFANTLNRFRLNQQTEEDMLLIQSRQVETNDVTYPVGALHIFAFNKEVDRHNSRMLQNLNVPTITIVAVDSKKDQQTGRVAMASHGAKESGVLKELKLAVGARVMMTTNVNVDDGLVNSAAGTVTGFLPTPPAAQDPEFSSYKPKYVLVHFDDARVGEATRAKLKKMIPDQVSTPVSQAEVLVKKRKISGKRIQFPLTLAWGITIHKSQGRTVEELVVSTSGSFKCGQMYTALSRVKSLEGLHILGDFQKNQVKTDERSIQELQRLIQRSKFKMEVPEAVAVSSELYFKLSLININSLKPHHKSLSEDTNISGSSIIALTETWLKNTDSSDGIMISDDYGLLRKDHYSARGIPQGGIALNIHKDFLIVRDLRYRVAQLQYLCILLSDRRDRDTRLLIVVIYNPPAVPAAVFLKQLDSLLCHIPCDSVTTILCGDFNIDGAGESKQSKDLEKVTSHYGFHQFVSAPTHKRGSTLDHVYINRNIQQSVLVSCIPVHYSDHFHVLLSVPYRCLLGSRY